MNAIECIIVVVHHRPTQKNWNMRFSKIKARTAVHEQSTNSSECIEWDSGECTAVRILIFAHGGVAFEITLQNHAILNWA